MALLDSPGAAGDVPHRLLGILPLQCLLPFALLYVAPMRLLPPACDE